MAAQWTTDEIDKFKTLWAANLSVSAIIQEFDGKFGKNHIVSKRYRLKLPTHKLKDRAPKVKRTHARPMQSTNREAVEAEIHALREAVCSDPLIKVGSTRWNAAVDRCIELRKSIGYVEPRSPVTPNSEEGMMTW